MTATAISKNQRVNLRLNGALTSAEQTIHEHETMTLSKRDAEAFFDALSKPVKLNTKLFSALEEHDRRFMLKPFIRDSVL